MNDIIKLMVDLLVAQEKQLNIIFQKRKEISEKAKQMGLLDELTDALEKIPGEHWTL